MAPAAGLGMWVALVQFARPTGPYDTCGLSGIRRPGGAVEIQLGSVGSGIAVAEIGGARV